MIISDEKQSIGDESHYIGYPLGIYQEGFAPWFDGRYIGKIDDKCAWTIGA